MKFIFLALLFIALGSTNASGYVKLSADYMSYHQIIEDLRDLGAKYTLQRGIFRNTKDPLENGDWVIFKTESVYRKITAAVTYYKYNVVIKSHTTPSKIKATYIVSFRPANGKTLITSYSYNNLNEYSPGLPQFIDTRIIAGSSYLGAKLKEGYDYTIAHAKAAGEIKKSTYHIGTIFSAGDNGETIPYVLDFLVTLVTKKGYTYRARISVPDLEGIPQDQWDQNPVTYGIYPNK